MKCYLETDEGTTLRMVKSGDMINILIREQEPQSIASANYSSASYDNCTATYSLVVTLHLLKTA